VRFLVFGAGAIGTYVGGSLALAGSEVVFLERPEAAAGLLAEGLRVETVAGAVGRIEHPSIVTDIRQALDGAAFDAAVLAVKSFDTAAVLEQMRPVCERMPAVLCLQNGVENEPALAAVLGAGRVVAGSVATAIGRLGPGGVRVERLRGIGIAVENPLGPRLVDALDAAGLRARPFADGRSMKWSKMLTNLAVNASCAVLDLSPAQVIADPRLFRLEIAMLRETLAVMAKLGIAVTDLPGTPVRALAFAAGSLPPWLSRSLLARSLGQGRGGKMPSFYIDLHAGSSRSEVDYLNGAVVRFGQQALVATPVNRALNETLLALAAGKIPIETYSHQPEKWLDRVNADLHK
jgi:2-dehydropantoate 2-reductase